MMLLAVLLALQEPVLDPPTLHSLGVYSFAPAKVQYRVKGAAEWRPGPPLFRVEADAQKSIQVPAGGTLWAGSILGLQPGTDYELDIGGRKLSARTAAEPVASKDAPVIHVRPGELTLKEAHDRARPGDVIVVHAGVYKPFRVTKSGEPGRPIVWRGEGEAVIDGGPIAIDASGIHDVWFERLTIRNAGRGMTMNNSARLVVRRCRFHAVEKGIVCTVNDTKAVEGFFIADNVLEGPFSWSMKEKGAGVEEWRGIQITGAGHDVCYNRISGFKDGIDTFPSPRVVAIDIHHNEISEAVDDGIELDGSERNVRCFENRLTNVFQGISVQPVHGGPAYVVRNILYNVVLEPFKMHSSPSGVLFYHNTVARKGTPFLLLTPHKVRNCVSRNNLFLGSDGNYGIENDAAMVDCDFDNDGFAGGPWKLFAKWNGKRYETLEGVRAKGPAYRRAVLVDPVPVPDDPDKKYPIGADLRLKPGSKAVDAGEVLPGINEGKPDLGAVELGSPLPPYGPRP